MRSIHNENDSARQSRQGTVARVSGVQERFALSLGQMGRMWRSQLERRLRQVGISLMQWQTLHFLATQVEPVVQKRLARAVAVEDPVMVGLLDRLEAARLVKRRASRHDRRAKTVHLCAKAKRVLQSAECLRRDMNTELLEGISDAELDTCARVFDIIAERLWAERLWTDGPGCGTGGESGAAPSDRATDESEQPDADRHDTPVVNASGACL